MDKGLYIKYPKFLLLILTFLIAYILFRGRGYAPFHDFIASSKYLGTFLAGAFFAYGFTAAPATSILIILAKEQNIILAGLIGGFGALIGDLIIFGFIRHSFANEIKMLSNERLVKNVYNKTPKVLKKYLIPVIAGFIIASPLPDEVGVSLLASSKTISLKIFSVASYLLNTAGIFLVLFIGHNI